MRLLERFFITVGAVIPCIDKSAFLKIWEEASGVSSRVVPRTTYALVNIVMAHASATLPNGNPIKFYRRFLELLDMQTVQNADIYTGMPLIRFEAQHSLYS